MLTQYHEAITRKALSARVSPIALNIIVAANLGQDNLSGQFGHDEYHFDNNAFEKGYAYLAEQRILIHTALEDRDTSSAWAAFGRLTHTVQDFYAHSNYIDLWLAQFAETPPLPTEIDPLVKEFLDHPNLHSGKLYYPIEALSFVPFLKGFIIPLLPKDSHAQMNLDMPEKGKRFAYAFEAAAKRTVVEFDATVMSLSEDHRNTFMANSK